MLPNLSGMSAGQRRLAAIGVEYTLMGNAKADWGMMTFKDYDRYLEQYKNWERMGWLGAGEQLLLPSGERTPKPPTKYMFLSLIHI